MSDLAGKVAVFCRSCAGKAADASSTWRADAYVPAGRLGEASEVAEVALFLGTTPATYLVGTDIVIDGGYTVH